MIKKYKDFLFEWGYGGEGGASSKDPVKVKDSMITDIDIEYEEEEEVRDIPILSDTSESATFDDVDPYGEEDWNDVNIPSYREWEGSIHDFLKLLNIPYINYTLDEVISKLTVKEFHKKGKMFDDLENSLAEHYFCTYEEYMAIINDFENLEELCVDFKPEEYEPDDFENFFNNNQLDGEFERRFNYFLHELFSKNGAAGAFPTNYDLPVLSYIHNHFYDVDLRNEYMKRIMNKENPKNVCMDIYKRVKKKTDILNNLMNTVEKISDNLNESKSDIDPYGEEDWNESVYNYKNWESKGGDIYDFLKQLKNEYIDEELMRIKDGTKEESDEYISDIWFELEEFLTDEEMDMVRKDIDKLKELCVDYDDEEEKERDPDEKLDLKRDRKYYD